MLDSIFKTNDWPIKGRSALDVGCGTGIFIDHWTNRGASPVAGVDITEVSVENLKSQYPEADFHHGDLTDPALNLEGTYDYISIFDVMFHMVEYGRFTQAAQNLAKLSRPGTKVFITDDFGTKTRSTLKHVRKRSLEMYKEVFSAAGFRLREVRPLFFMMLPPEGFANSILRWAGILSWEALTLPARWQVFGGLWGRIMYGFDSVMRKIFKQSPSGQLAVFEFQGT